MQEVALFISAVTSEFGNCRPYLREVLTRPNVAVKIQDEFKASGKGTLDKLNRYIAKCDAVVHLVGEMTGALAPAVAVQEIRESCPDLATRFPELKSVFEGVELCSYTQWEAYLGRYHDKELVIARPSMGFPRDARFATTEEQRRLQHAHVERLKSMGKYPEIEFGTLDKLAAELLASSILDLLVNSTKGASLHKPNNLPYPSIGNLFIGREAFMARLHDEYLKQKQSNQPLRQCIHGLGGVGKTRAAVEYAWGNALEAAASLFITGVSREALRHSFTGLFTLLRSGTSRSSDLDINERIAAVSSWLQGHSDWLLIVDSVDTPDVVAEVERLLSGVRNGQVLYTSRISTWAAHIVPHELSVLDQTASRYFILERTDAKRRKGAHDGDEASLIAQDLDGLALALEQAAAYINEGRHTLADYREQWMKKNGEIMSWYDPVVMNYPKSIAVTWLTTIDHLQHDAQRLLQSIAWMSPDAIPESFLEVELVPPPAWNRQRGYAELLKYSMITASQEALSFRVHRLVQAVSRNHQGHESNDKIFKETLDWMYDAFRGDPRDVRVLRAREALYPHAAMLCSWGEGRAICNPVPHLLTDIAAYFMYLTTEYVEAEQYLRRALALCRNHLGPEDRDTVGCMNNLAQLLKTTGRLTEAEALMREVLIITEKYVEPNAPILEGFLNNLGTLLLENDCADEAEPLLRRALEIAESNFGEHDQRVARCLHNLAEALSILGSREEAEAMARRNLSILEDSLGVDHPLVATSLNNLARIINQPSRFRECEAILRRALSIRRAELPDDHPETAIALNNLAEVLWLLGDRSECRAMMREHLVILSKVGNRSGTEHPYFGRGRDMYSKLLHSLGLNAGEVAVELDAAVQDAAKG